MLTRTHDDEEIVERVAALEYRQGRTGVLCPGA